MRFAFVTCVQIGKSCIEEIYNLGQSIELVITLKNNKAQNKSGRIFLDKFCMEKDIELLKIDNINDKLCQEKIIELNIDWLFIIGWSQIAKAEILKAPKFGAIGAHPTLLPQGRGRASIPWAILKSLKYTGVTFFKLDENVDTGKIIIQEKIYIDNNENASTLYHKVVLMHMKLISEIVKIILNSSISFKEQNENYASYWPGRKPEDGELNFNGKVSDADKLIRATTKPYPGAFFIENGLKIIVWKAKIVKQNNQELFKNRNILKFKDGFLEIQEFTEEKIG